MQSQLYSFLRQEAVASDPLSRSCGVNASTPAPGTGTKPSQTNQKTYRTLNPYNEKVKSTWTDFKISVNLNVYSEQMHKTVGTGPRVKAAGLIICDIDFMKCMNLSFCNYMFIYMWYVHSRVWLTKILNPMQKPMGKHIAWTKARLFEIIGITQADEMWHSQGDR